MILIHHLQSEHICMFISVSFFKIPSSYWSSQLCRGMKIPTFYLLKSTPNQSSLEVEKDSCDDSTDLPPAKQTPMITPDSFSGLPFSYLSSQL